MILVCVQPQIVYSCLDSTANRTHAELSFLPQHCARKKSDSTITITMSAGRYKLSDFASLREISSKIPLQEPTKLRQAAKLSKKRPVQLCKEELAATVACLKKPGPHSQCKDVAAALDKCMETSIEARKKASQHKSTDAYHVQRLSQQMGYKFHD